MGAFYGNNLGIFSFKNVSFMFCDRIKSKRGRREKRKTVINTLMVLYLNE